MSRMNTDRAEGAVVRISRSGLARLVIALVVVVVVALGLGPPGAAANTPANYLTWNAAGANSTYSPNATQRVAHADLLRLAVAGHSPTGTAAQEVCDNTSASVWDQEDEFADIMNDYLPQFYGQGLAMKVLSNIDCRQENWAYAKGVPYDGDYRVLPYDGHETRAVVCAKATGYVISEVCSTHLSTVSVADRNAQSLTAYDFTTNVYGGNAFARWLGGDFNAEETSTAASWWYANYYESDRFYSPPRNTENGKKIDFGFGKVSVVRSDSGAGLARCGSVCYSDHSLLWAPYTWVF